jgi:hypothetical protein
MATSNLIIKSVGNIQIESGSGIPNHISPKGSLYSDSITGYSYINNGGSIWRRIQRPNNANLFMNSNTTLTVTPQFNWSNFQGVGSLEFFEGSNFTYSSTSIQLISPTGVGVFENTTTTGEAGFDQNGWVVVNGAQTNKWFVGITGASGSGFGAYVSNTNGSTNNYGNGTSVTYFYRDVVIPPYVSTFTLEFAIRVSGDANDYTRVYFVPSTTTFTAGTNQAAGTQLLQLNTRTGYQNSSTTFQITPSGNTQSRRLAFSWVNNVSTATQPPSSIDNISLTANPPLNLTYTGSQSLFKSFLSGTLFSSVSITNVTFLISKNGSTQSNPSETRYNSLTTKEGFSTQNTFTMSNGETIYPLVVNNTSNTNLTISDFSLNVIEIHN